MKYIGPFLRISTLNKNNIENQLFYLSKESLKHIVLHSKCGITTNLKELKIKNISQDDISTFGKISPLLCIYKKANCKLTLNNNILCWNEDKFKKEVVISSNVLMTLSLMELSDYYRKLENINNKKSILSHVYETLSKKQLEFMAAYFRNNDGVFVDKKDSSNPLTNELKFEEKNKGFEFSNQALFMAACYKYSILDEKDGDGFRTFSLDILNMLINFRDEIYLSSFDELVKISFGINLFSRYSNLPESKALLMDITDFIIESFDENMIDTVSNDNLENICLFFINLIIIYNDTDFKNIYDICNKIYKALIELYNPDIGIFMKQSDKKEIKFSSAEIMLYLISLILYSHINDNQDKNCDLIITNVFKHQVVNSGIIPSWPDAPNLDDAERYKNFSLKHEDLLNDENFRMVSIPTPEKSELAPVFIKYVTYNRKKNDFSESKLSFDSSKNMLIFFILIYLFKK